MNRLGTTIRRSRRWIIAGATAIVSLGLAACGSSGGSTSASAHSHVPLTTVNLGEPLSPPQIPQMAPYIAKDLGYFAKEHLNVHIVSMPNGLTTELGTTANSITIGMAAGSDSITAASQHAPIQAVWVDYQKLDLECIGGPTITSIKDLVGKNVGSTGAGGFSATTIGACLSAGGVKASQVHEITMTNAEFVPALETGRIQAAVFHANAAYTVLHSVKGAHVLDKEYQTLPLYWYGSLNVKNAYAQAHAPIVERTIAAMILADRWMLNPKNNSRFVALAMAATGESRNSVQAGITFDRAIPLWNTSCAVSPASVAFTSRLLLAQHVITSIPSFNQVYNGTYCAGAMKLLG